MKIKEVSAIVTGGASGLGLATAREFLERGASVSIFDLENSNTTSLVAKLNEDFEGKVIVANVDVTDSNSVTKALGVVNRRFGKINVLVNCAGVAIAKKTTGKEGAHPLDLYQKVIDVNLVGTFNMVRLSAIEMEKNKPNDSGERGCIINTASVAAFDGQKGQAAYSASKGGVAASTLPLARDLASSNIRVNTIAPGLFLTPMLEGLPEEAKEDLAKQVVFPKRLGSPTEFAKLASFMIQSEYLNGETVRLDGAIRLP